MRTKGRNSQARLVDDNDDDADDDAKGGKQST